MNIALGGMSDASHPETQPILQKALRAGLRIHSCYFYGDALDSIASAADATGIEPPLTLKIYFESDAVQLNAAVSVQLERIRKRLPNFSFKTLDLQLCCNPDVRFFDNPAYRFDTFLNATLRRELPNARLLIESFVDWAPNVERLVALPAIDGLIFYNNAIMREVRPDVFAATLARGDKHLAGMRVLGGGDKPDNDLKFIPAAYHAAWQDLFKQSGAKSYVDFNVMYAKATSRVDYHVLSVSSEQHLDSVLEKFTLLPALVPELFSAVETLKDKMWRANGTANPYFTPPLRNPLSMAGARRLKRSIAKALRRGLGGQLSPWVS